MSFLDPQDPHGGHERLALLARTTSLFASGIDLNATLRNVADIFVPGLAQAAAIDLLEGPAFRRVAFAIDDAGASAPPPLEMTTESGLSPQERSMHELLQRGEPLVIQVRAFEDFPYPPTSAARADFLRAAMPLSVIVAPLRAHGVVLGVMQVMSMRGSRTYSADDASLVADVAQRAAFAIHNARLVRQLTNELELSSNALSLLEESERRYRRIFEGNPLPLWLYDLETLRFMDVNPAAVADYGYSRDEFLAMSILDIRPDSERDKVHAALRDIERGTHQPRVFRHRRKDGTVILAEIHSHDVELEGRRCRMVQAIDVTERVRTLQSLRSAEERHRLLTRVTKEAIWEWNGDSNTMEWTQALYDLFNFAPDEVIPTGTWFLSRIHPDDLGRSHEIQRLIAESGTETLTAAFRFQRGDGSYASVESRMVIARRDGKVERIVGSLADVTTEQAVSEQLAIAQRMEAVGRLAGGVAHDFNNLLTAIRGFASFALDDQLPSSRARDDIEQILQATDRAAALTRQLLAFSRRQVLQPQVVRVNELLRNLLKMLARVLGEDVEVQTFLDPDVAAVTVDPGQFEQVIMNLVVNARDAMPNGGLLTIETANVFLDEAYAETHLNATAGEHVMIAITDSGTGMDAATMARIFEPFFSTKERDKGTGLGLATSYGIIRQSLGHIWVYSEPGKGSTFKVYLPRAASDDACVPRTTSEGAMHLSGSETILVVEDDDRVRRVSTGALTRHGYHVLEARSAESALNVFKAEEEWIAMVVTDIVLPRMSGLALVREMRQLRPELRVLYVSGYTENAFLQSGAIDPAMDLLEKPFAPEALARRVRAILDRPATPRPLDS
ncbi:MAG: PAS domain S-box protein [Gemmatimonadaceae bacterium]|nr:PAS domain S-box protein [Gemmatimonadaceae bacterium]